MTKKPVIHVEAITRCCGCVEHWSELCDECRHKLEATACDECRQDVWVLPACDVCGKGAWS